jgi:glycosyltransferase 2 family protein
VLASRFLVGRTRVDPARTVVATRNYLLAFGAYAVSAVLVQTAVSGPHDPLAVAGAAALAWGAGLVIVIAPGGIGVREAVYVALLAGTLPTAEVAAAAVAMRVMAVVAELLVLVAAGRPTPEPAASTSGSP